MSGNLVTVLCNGDFHLNLPYLFVSFHRQARYNGRHPDEWPQPFY
jgi:hypothetical protein